MSSYDDIVKELIKSLSERIEKGENNVCVNCDCKEYCNCGCYGVGECVVCKFDSAEWKCKVCGGWVCDECIVVGPDSFNLCWSCEDVYWVKVDENKI